MVDYDDHSLLLNVSQSITVLGKPSSQHYEATLASDSRYRRHDGAGRPSTGL